ncbi:MAG TPA: peroxiredoxin-like family protein [Galbitalea sp.]|jgi:peroxiredoxin|nr:peroxiredoxin-like family protein [Galbitalea sp.]
MAQLSPTIADQVAEMQSKRTPTPASEKFSAEQHALARTMPQSVLEAGSVFPDGDLIDAEGRPTTLAETLSGAPGVVIFYRGAWCPYCNIALRTYRDQLTLPLRQLGVVLVALSPQSADGSMTMKEKHDLEFPVLSDPGNQIAGALGILTRPTDGARHAQLEHGLDLEKVNADGTTTVPMPTVALIDAEGVLAWIDVHPDYTTRTEPSQVLDAVNEYLSSAQPNGKAS